MIESCETGEDPANTVRVEFGERKAVVREAFEDDRRDQESGNNKEDIDTEKAAGKQGGAEVIGNDRQDGDSAQPVDVRAIVRAHVLLAGIGRWRGVGPAHGIQHGASLSGDTDAIHREDVTLGRGQVGTILAADAWVKLCGPHFTSRLRIGIPLAGSGRLVDDYR